VDFRGGLPAALLPSVWRSIQWPLYFVKPTLAIEASQHRMGITLLGAPNSECLFPGFSGPIDSAVEWPFVAESRQSVSQFARRKQAIHRNSAIGVSAASRMAGHGPAT
jgi:hypothetical protein